MITMMNVLGLAISFDVRRGGLDAWGAVAWCDAACRCE